MSVNAGLILIVMGLLRRIFPLPPLEEATSLSMDQLKEKYRRTNLLGNILVRFQEDAARGL
jgi:hypothetical protein